MTSTEFAARYRLLKNVATRGARSFLAQHVELGRMVMVHYLDSGTPQQRAATLARLGTLRPPTRDKLLEIVDVDGSPVAVTLFLGSFVDFATWLDSVSAPIEPAPTSAASEFTGLFGKVDEPDFSRSRESMPSGPSEEDFNSPTLIMKPVKPPRPAQPIAPTPSVSARPAAPPPIPPPAPASSAGFTAIFGRLSDMSPDPMPSSASTMPPALDSNRSFPPVAPPPSPSPDAYRADAPTPSAAPGEFTQLFQRISPAAGGPPISPFPFPAMPTPQPAPPSFRAPESSRQLDRTPGADLGPPPLATPFLAPPAALPTPSLGESSAPPPSLGSFGAIPSFGGAMPPLAPPTPHFSDAPPPSARESAPPAMAPAPMWGAAAPPTLGAPLDVGVQSEFTRMLGRVAVPPPPPSIAPLPTAAAATAPAEQRPKKSLAPLLIALNVVVLLTIAIVAYFMLRKG